MVLGSMCVALRIQMQQTTFTVKTWSNKTQTLIDTRAPRLQLLYPLWKVRPSACPIFMSNQYLWNVVAVFQITHFIQISSCWVMCCVQDPDSYLQCHGHTWPSMVRKWCNILCRLHILKSIVLFWDNFTQMFTLLSQQCCSQNPGLYLHSYGL